MRWADLAKRARNVMKIGNLFFDEFGVSITRKYSNPDDAPSIQPSEGDKEKALKCALDYLKGRMSRCLRDLEANFASATYVGPDMVIWPGGRFNVTLYTSMMKVVDNPPKSWDELDKIELQQIIRAIKAGYVSSDTYWGSSKDLAFNIATELIILE